MGTSSGRRNAALVGAVLLCIGSLLDWATVTTGFGQIGVAGTKGDGKATLVAGGIAIASFAYRRMAVGATASLLGGAVAIYDWINLQSQLGSASSQFASIDVGIGLHLCVIGGVIATIAGFAKGTIGDGAAAQRPGVPGLNSNGWWPDPTHRHQLRYWADGRWTEHVSNDGRQAVDDPMAG